MLEAAEIKDIRKNLGQWFAKNKRPLPFRKTKNPYNIWLSEIMAQQTTMTAVIDYYQRFIKKFPSLESVATAKEQDLLHLWQGLGYYSRIRNFQKACQQVIKEHNGKIPQQKESLLALKGIGDYTAAAISSICFNKPHAVIDGNVKRVLSRLYYYKKDPKTKEARLFFENHAQNLLDKKNPGDFNEAMMELGALICTPKSPKCLLCPLQKNCQARGKNPEALPLKTKQKFIETRYASIIIHDNKNFLLKKPQPDNLIKNMWELPSLYQLDLSPKDALQHDIKLWEKTFKTPLALSNVKPIGTVKHGITNKKITTSIYELRISSSGLTKLDANGFKVLEKGSLKDIPLNTLSRKILKKFHQSP